MSQSFVPRTATATFVLRFWRETMAGEVRWRGRIEHVQSGEKVSFLDLEGMQQFIRHFCRWVDDSNQLTSEEV